MFRGAKRDGELGTITVLPFPFDRSWPLGWAVEIAGVLEASAAKVGNVHPQASFNNMGFAHFVTSAVATGPVFECAAQWHVGKIVLQAVLATRQAAGCNTNLGTLLLFAPLAKAHCGAGTSLETLRSAVTETLAALQPQDAEDVYKAIRAAQPGGLGESAEADVAGPPPKDLRAAMAMVANTDAVARQYTQNFADIFDRLVPWLKEELCRCGEPLEALCRLQLRWLAHEPDGLIIRKAGSTLATQIQEAAAGIAAKCLSRTEPLAQQPEIWELDQLLRADGHRRNPGTTADLIAATILVLLLVGGT